MSPKRAHEDAELDSGRRPQAPRLFRTRACVECKKHKIKCEPVDGDPKCAKCLRGGVECVPYNLNQILQEEDVLWKTNATAEIAQLRSAVQQLLQHSKLPALASWSGPSPSTAPAVAISPANVLSESGACTTMVAPPMDMTRENSVERDYDNESSLVPAPMRSFPVDSDFIGQGIIPVEDAEDLFTRYIENYHQLLWAGILFSHASLEEMRRHSTLLTAAVLTIAALHTPGRDDALQKCYNIFVSLAYSTCLSKPNNLDDVRALCLAAFYLSNLSWKLSGLAVRNAVELGIHHSFQKLIRGNTDHRDNVRLWYALYVCEHQFSIAYGRPPLIHEDAATKNLERFLDSPLTTPGDIRLGSQVALFKILTEAYMVYGGDPEQPLTEPDFQQLRIFNLAIEQWRLSWQPRSVDSSPIGSYPSKAVVLYYHFARFQLNSLALRALPAPSAASSESFSHDRREAANIAITAATSTLALIFEEPDLRRALSGVPIFTHTMVAFCATFLLKMAKTWGGVAQAASPEWTMEPIGLGLNFNIGQVLSLTRRSANLQARVAESLNEKHLIRHIVAGVRELLNHFDTPGTPSSQDNASLNLPISARATAMEHTGTNGAVSNTGVDLMNGYSMYYLIGSYGFGFDETYLGQAASSDFDQWST
ncbi:fungal-specific transcription factor-like protein [Massariosphaeria phaeospora]|uniref:Fungal-specific transcription factor-like protein n=1 Tax=Massariosphaeria phaeospora TaxID=100035 RepID=A0A7C8MMB0_9PLEO|nr:fungal-specific transcription factor-like protein [Massariosphaeria phaeospora]